MFHIAPAEKKKEKKKKRSVHAVHIQPYWNIEGKHFCIET